MLHAARATLPKEWTPPPMVYASRPTLPRAWTPPSPPLQGPDMPCAIGEEAL